MSCVDKIQRGYENIYHFCSLALGLLTVFKCFVAFRFCESGFCAVELRSGESVLNLLWFV